jgi:hypothetical protein
MYVQLHLMGCSSALSSLIPLPAVVTTIRKLVGEISTIALIHCLPGQKLDVTPVNQRCDDRTTPPN